MSNIEWIVIPNKSVNGLEFGIERPIVRKTIGKPKRVFSKTSTSANTTDDYSDFHVYYSADDKLEAIEFFGRNIKLLINTRQVFPGTLSTIKEILPDLEECCGSYISKADSIGVGIEEENIDSLLVGCKNYYRRV